jgi:hypothetical protein
MKKMIVALCNSKRVWLTVTGLFVLAMSKMGHVLPDDFADQSTKMIMVLVASFGATGFGKEKK